MEKIYPKTVNENNNNIIKNILFSGTKSELTIEIYKIISETLSGIYNENKKYKIKEYSCRKIYQEYINCLSFNNINQCNEKYLKFMNFCT